MRDNKCNERNLIYQLTVLMSLVNCADGMRLCLWQAILLGLGLQHRTVESLSAELNNLAIGQILGIFNQLIRQIQTVSVLPLVSQSHLQA